MVLVGERGAVVVTEELPHPVISEAITNIEGMTLKLFINDILNQS